MQGRIKCNCNIASGRKGWKKSKTSRLKGKLKLQSRDLKRTGGDVADVETNEDNKASSRKPHTTLGYLIDQRPADHFLQLPLLTL